MFSSNNDKEVKRLIVALSCYNQQAYIKECLDHLLAQDLLELNDQVEVEVAIFDDGSNDDTLCIVKSILGEHPKASFAINVIDNSNKENIGMHANTDRIFDYFRESQSDYCCILEGDDYWISPFWVYDHIKPLLDSKVYSMSNNYIMFYDQASNHFSVRNYPDDINGSAILTASMVSTVNYCGNLTSCMYSTKHLKNIPDVFFEEDIDDWYITILLALQGDIVSIKKPLSVYRVHNKSVWNGRVEEGTIKKTNPIIQRIELIEREYPGRCIEELNQFATTWGLGAMQSKLYFDRGSGFSENDTLVLYPSFPEICGFEINCDLDRIPYRIKALRFDPVEGHRCLLNNLLITIDGKEILISNMNGAFENGVIMFDTLDPWMELQYSDGLRGHTGKRLHIQGYIYID